MESPRALPSVAAGDDPHEPYKTIGETAKALDLPQHVLRFWESKFPHLKPLKLRDNRRYYNHAMVEFLRLIKRLLYAEGYTIRGAQRLLNGKDARAIKELSRTARTGAHSTDATDAMNAMRRALQSAIGELEEIAQLLDDDPAPP